MCLELELYESGSSSKVQSILWSFKKNQKYLVSIEWPCNWFSEVYVKLVAYWVKLAAYWVKL